MRVKTFIDIISYLFIFLFLYTGVIKFIDNAILRGDIRLVPVVRIIAPILAILLPLGEVLTALSLILSKTRRLGLLSSFILMLLFTLYVGYMLAYVPNRPCSCGGIIQKMNWHQHFYFNLIFTILALTAFILDKKQKKQENTQTASIAYS